MPLEFFVIVENDRTNKKKSKFKLNILNYFFLFHLILGRKLASLSRD